MTDEIVALAAEIRAGATLTPRERRSLPGLAEAVAARPPLAPSAPAQDRRGRALDHGDPILFAVPGGAFAGVYAGTYAGRGNTGRMRARIDPGEPSAGKVVEISAFSTLRARREDIVADVRSHMTEAIARLQGRQL